MANLLSYLNRFEDLGSETAFVQQAGYRSVRWSYRGVFELACRFARELEARGVAKGDRVMIWGPNCAEWAGAFFGCMLRGAVAVPMDLIAARDFAARVFESVDAKLLVCSRDLGAATGRRPALILEDMPRDVSRHNCGRYPAAPDPEDVLQIVFTSGTTAEPKGVVITCRNLLANLEPLEAEIRKYLRYERIFHPLRFLLLLPLSHVFGQFMGMFVPPLLGATVVFQDSLSPSEVIRRTKRERVSVIVTVPRLLGSLKDKIERDFEAARTLDSFRARFAAARDRHFLRRWWIFRKIHRKFGWKFWAFISGGAALDPDVEQFWTRLSFAVVQGYGLTESTSLISVNHPLKPGRGSIGQVLPGREIRLDSSGEILVRGANMAAGYFQASALSPILQEEGWFHTGDLGAIDDGGNLYFNGRNKEVIVTPEGMKVHPEDLEAALRRQPEVRDCVVIGLEQGGNAEPCAVLVMRDRTSDPAEIVRRTNTGLAGFQHVRRWFVWPEEDLPRTSTQKPRTEAIRNLVQSRLSGEGSPSQPPGSLAELIGRIRGKRLGPLHPGASLAGDLDLSSVDRVELLSAIEDRYQLDLDETQFTSATTLEDLENMLRQPAAGKSAHRYPGWALGWPARLVRLAAGCLLIRPVTYLLARPEIRGKANLLGMSGPLLLISNHITQVDACLILAALPPAIRHRLAVAMSGEILQSLREPTRDLNLAMRLKAAFSYWLVTALFNVFPLPQESGFRESFVFAGEAADRGYSILVFPEGHRTTDGAIAPFRNGIGLLARNLGLPVIPMRIDGLYELNQRGRRFARRGEIAVSIGKPVLIKPGEPLEAIAGELRQRVLDVPSS